MCIRDSPFKWAARDVGSEANALKVAVIDKGADVQLTLDGPLAVSAVGTQVQNTGGTKSGYIYAWDATTNTVSLITSDTWDTSDVVENGVTDRNISSVSDWYDNQEVWTGFKWSQIAPRPVSYTHLTLPTILRV